MQGKENTVTEEEIRQMVDAGGDNGSIDENEKEMINNIFELGNISAGNIATHRTDIVAVPLNATLEDKKIGAKNIAGRGLCSRCIASTIGGVQKPSSQRKVAERERGRKEWQGIFWRRYNSFRLLATLSPKSTSLNEGGFGLRVVRERSVRLVGVYP